MLAPRHQTIIMSNFQFDASQLCAGGSICSDKSPVSNTFGYQLGHFPENGLSFFGNNHDEEDRIDPLYYNWADIDTYGDVDDMYRSSDSTCELRSTHEDGLGWFSLSDTVLVTEDALNDPCSVSKSRKRIFQNDDPSRLDYMTHLSTVSDLQELSTTYKGNSLPSIKYEEQGQLDSSAIKGSSSLLVDDNSSHHTLLSSKDSNKKLKCQKQSGLSRNQPSENDSSFYIEDISKAGQQPAQAQDSKPFGYLQDDTPYTCSVYSSLSDITSLPETVNQSENISLKSPSLHDVYALDGMQPMKGSTEALLPVVSSASGDTGDQMYQHEGFKASSNDDTKNVKLAFHMSMSDTISNETPVHLPTKNECNSGINVSISEKSEGSGKREDSESFKLDDISVGASFRQLQLVMSRLDSRTKLCIRDSLYRLACNAEQRHYYESLESGFMDDRYSTLPEGRNMNMKMETDTNPIDRSIAHLLFHRASDQSVLAG